MNDLSPPWVLFCDDGQAVAILPAGRPGEVANVRHLTRERASEIVRLANALHAELRVAKMVRALEEVRRLTVDGLSIEDGAALAGGEEG